MTRRHVLALVLALVGLARATAAQEPPAASQATLDPAVLARPRSLPQPRAMPAVEPKP